MEDVLRLTRFLLEFSDRRRGWISVRRGNGGLSLAEFVRFFEAFLNEREPSSPRRRAGWLYQIIPRCLDEWNRQRNRYSAKDDAAAVRLQDGMLTNVAFARHRATRRGCRGGGTRKRDPRPSNDLYDTTPSHLPELNPRALPKEGEGLPMKGEIVVRTEFAGAILGRRGWNINAIRDQTGAQVHLQGSPDGQTRLMEVCGTESQVREAHRMVNRILNREYPDTFLKSSMVPMRATIELKMSIERATYLTGMNRVTLAGIESNTAVSVTLQGKTLNVMTPLTMRSEVEGEEGTMCVRLQGNYDRIIEAYQAVMGVLDTYEAWFTANQNYETNATGEATPPTDQPSSGAPTGSPATGTVLQVSTAWVVQQDGSCKEMQIYLPASPTPAATPTVVQTGAQGPDAAMAEDGLYSAQPRTRFVHYPLGVEARATSQPTRVVHASSLSRREPQTMYAPLTQALAPPSVEQSQGVLFPDATANLYYTPSLGTRGTPMILSRPKQS